MTISLDDTFVQVDDSLYPYNVVVSETDVNTGFVIRSVFKIEVLPSEEFVLDGQIDDQEIVEEVQEEDVIEEPEVVVSEDGVIVYPWQKQAISQRRQRTNVGIVIEPEPLVATVQSLSP